MAAGIATLQELRDDPPYAAAGATRQKAERRARTRRAQPPACRTSMHRVGSMWTLFFTADPVVDYDTAKKSDTARFARFFWAMMDRGVYLPCSQFEAAFLSAAHTEEQVGETIAAARQALAEIAN